MAISRHHFEGFDTLRFFAFLLVFLQHSVIPDGNPIAWFSHAGGIGVSLFFVLSGFLISYILLFEKANRGTIALKNYFIRRSLRIWPLFYAMVLFAFATPYILDILQLPYSSDGYTPDWYYSFFFLENYKMMATRMDPNVSPLVVMWSLCIEEHFYILWGLALYCCKKESFPWIAGASALLAIAVRSYYYCANIPTLDLFSNWDYFAIGGLAAYAFLVSSSILRRLEKLFWFRWQLLLPITLCAILWLPALEKLLPAMQIINPTIYALLFTCLLLLTFAQRHRWHLSDTSWTGKLGKYTYAAYLFHTIIISFFKQILPKLGWDLHWFFLAVLNLALTLLASYLSYQYFERFFLRYKRYFYAKSK